jgi:hypothetical protein
MLCFADHDNASDPIATVATQKSNSNSIDSTDTNIDKSPPKNSIKSSTQDAIGNMLLQSISLMGIAYKWGGNTPDTGMDCSGFVRYVFKKSLGITLPRTAAEMAKVGKKIDIKDLQPGDLIFFKTMGGSRISHIGIYMGNNKFIQSPRTGENIQISDFSGYWVQHYVGAKRIVQQEEDGDGNTSLENYQDIRNEALPSGSGGGRYSHSRRHGRNVKYRHGNRHQIASASRSGHIKATKKTGRSSKSKMAKSSKTKKKH